MKNIKLNKVLLFSAVISLLAVACSKKDEVVPESSTLLSSKKNITSISSITLNDIYTDTIPGNAGSPFDPSSFDTVFYDFENQAVTASGGQIGLHNRVNSYISATNSSYTQYYISVAGKSLTTINATDVNNAISNNQLKDPIGNGDWYTYVSTVPTPVSDYYIAITDGTYAYVVQLKNFVNITSGGVYPNLWAKSDTWIDYKKIEL